MPHSMRSRTGSEVMPVMHSAMGGVNAAPSALSSRIAESQRAG